MAKTRKLYDPKSGRSFTLDGELLSALDGEYFDNATAERIRKAFASRARSAANRREKDSVLRGLGLVKVRGALGGTYWE